MSKNWFHVYQSEHNKFERNRFNVGHPIKAFGNYSKGHPRLTLWVFSTTGPQALRIDVVFAVGPPA